MTNWSRAEHATFGSEFNRRVGALMLGLRRLERRRAAPAMDPAVLEEMLEAAALEPLSMPEKRLKWMYKYEQIQGIASRHILVTLATKQGTYANALEWALYDGDRLLHVDHIQLPDKRNNLRILAEYVNPKTFKFRAYIIDDDHRMSKAQILQGGDAFARSARKQHQTVNCWGRLKLRISMLGHGHRMDVKALPQTYIFSSTFHCVSRAGDVATITTKHQKLSMQIWTSAQ